MTHFSIAEMMHGEDFVAVLKRVPCSDGPTCGCYEAERVLTLTPAAARELAGDLQRGARYVDERAALPSFLRRSEEDNDG